MRYKVIVYYDNMEDSVHNKEGVRNCRYFRR